MTGLKTENAFIRQWLLYTGLGLLALLVRLPTLGSQPLWNDEAFSLATSMGSLAHTLAMIANDFHPPAYYLLLNAWMRVFGDDVETVRLLSVAFGTLTVPLVAAIASRIGGTKAAVTAGVLLAISPLHVQWSQIARGYSLMSFMVVLNMYASVHLIERLPARLSERGNWPLYVIYAGSLAGAVLSHNASLFYAGAAFLALMFLAVKVDSWRGALKFVVPLHVMAALPVLPWGLHAVDQASRIMHMQTESVYTVVEPALVFSELTNSFGVAFSTLKSAGIACALLLLVTGFWVLRHRRVYFAWLCVLTILLPLGLVFGWETAKPVLGRVLLVSRWLQAPLFILAGCAAAAEVLFVRRAALTVVAGLCFLSILGLRNYYQIERLRWPEAARISADRKYAGLPHIARDGSSVWAWDYYLRKLGASGATRLEEVPRLPDRFLLSANTPGQVDDATELKAYRNSVVYSGRDVMVFALEKK